MRVKSIATIARDAAIASGAKFYQGNPCAVHPDESRKWVSNYSCLACTKAQIGPYRENNKAKLLGKRRDWDAANPVKAMLQRARARAKRLGIEFSLSEVDIVIPEACPVFGTPLARHTENSSDAPSLDRIDNGKGYVSGNVCVISFKANRIKNNASVEELRKVIKYYEQSL